MWKQIIMENRKGRVWKVFWGLSASMGSLTRWGLFTLLGLRAESQNEHGVRGVGVGGGDSQLCFFWHRRYLHVPKGRKWSEHRMCVYRTGNFADLGVLTRPRAACPFRTGPSRGWERQTCMGMRGEMGLSEPCRSCVSSLRPRGSLHIGHFMNSWI